IVVVAADLALLLAAVEIDDPIVAVAGADEHEDALPRTILDELHAVRRLELTHAAGRLAVQEQRIVAKLLFLPVPVQPERPRLKRRDARGLPQIGEQAGLADLHVRAALVEHGGRRVAPIAAERIAAEARRAVVVARRGPRTLRRG